MLRSDPQPARPAHVQALIDALVRLDCSTAHLLACIHDAHNRIERGSRPSAVDWPEQKARRDENARKRIAEAHALKRDDLLYPPDDETGWSRLLIELRDAFVTWHQAISNAIELAPGVHKEMDGDEKRRPHRWTEQLITELHRLAGTLDPGALGDDGLGLVRNGAPRVPDDLTQLRKEILHRRHALLNVTEQSLMVDVTVRWPAPFKLLWDHLHAVYLDCQHVYGQWQELEQQLNDLPDRRFLKGLLKHWAGLPESISSKALLADHFRLRMRGQQTTDSPPRVWFNHLDELAFAVRNLRSHIDAALSVVENGEEVMDDLKKPKARRWSSHLRGVLMQLLGLIPRNDRDLPLDLGKGPCLAWETAWSQLQKAMNQMKAASPGTQSGHSKERQIGEGMSPREARKLAETCVKANAGVWPGTNILANRVGCSKPTLAKAVKSSPYLQAREAEHHKRRSERSNVRGSTGADLSAVRDTREVDPKHMPNLARDELVHDLIRTARDPVEADRVRSMDKKDLDDVMAVVHEDPESVRALAKSRSRQSARDRSRPENP